MSVRFLSHDNQDASYAKAAAIGAATGYLANNILPSHLSGQGLLQSKILDVKAKSVGMISKTREYNLIRREINNGTISLDNLTKDVFMRNRNEILRGRVDNVLSKNNLPEEAANTLRGITKRIIDKGIKAKNAVMDNAASIAKHSKGSALTYTLFGALAALSFLTISNSAKSISDITDRQLNVDMKA